MREIVLFLFVMIGLISCGNDQKATDFANALKQGDGDKIVMLLPDAYASGVRFSKDEFVSNFSAFSKAFIKDVQISLREKDIYDVKVVFTNNQEILSKIAFDNSKLEPSSFELFLSDIDKVVMKSYATNTFKLSSLNNEIATYYAMNSDLPKQWSDITNLTKGDIVSFGFSKPCVELKLNHKEYKVDVNIINQDDFYCKNFIESNKDIIEAFKKGYGGGKIYF